MWPGFEQIDYNAILPEFSEALARIERDYPAFTRCSQRRSIANLEMFWLCGIIRLLKPKFIFESGILRGRSTLVMAEMLKGAPTEFYCASITDHPDFVSFRSNYPIRPIFEPGETAIDHAPSDGTMVVLIDGPKARSHAARVIYGKIRDRRDLLGVFQHDVVRSTDCKSFQSFFGKNKRPKRWSLEHIQNSFVSRYRPMIECEDASFFIQNNFAAWLRNRVVQRADH